MEKREIISAFDRLGVLMRLHGESKAWPGFSCGVTEEEYQTTENVIQSVFYHNGWFTEELVRKSMLNIGNWLTENLLNQWLSPYSFANKSKNVAVIMAGNIPLVGFHDFLCVLVSGNHIQCKLSSEDNKLLPRLVFYLQQFAPQISERITFSDRNLRNFDAVIATGSNNSLTHFENYFSKYPHLFRHNRTSVAVLDGTETPEELTALGWDILDYFGRGCRNVSHLILPNNFELNRFFEAVLPHSEVINNKKYGNNYDYNKAIHLMNQAIFLDNNFLLLKESKDLFSPLSLIHYHFYVSNQEVSEYLQAHQDSIQCVVGHGFIPFGEAQCPHLDDYADNVDTMRWLEQLT